MGVKALASVLSVICIFGFSGLSSAVEPIKVGIPIPLTGAFAVDGVGSKQGIEFAIDEINEAGGLLGRPLEKVIFDTKEFAPETLMQAADKLVGRDKVDAVHAGWAGWGQDLRAFGRFDVPFFHLDGAISSIEIYREDPKMYSNVFQLDDIEKAYGRDIFDVMEKLPYQYPNKKIAVIVADDPWGRGNGEGLKERAKEKGWEIALDQVVPYGTREWGPILTKIRKIKPAFIYVEILSAPDVITFFRQFMEAPTQSLLNYGYSMAPPDFIKTLGEEGNGIMGDTIGIPLPVGPTPEATAWLEKFRAKYGNDPLSVGFPAYTGVMMWAEAVKKVGDPSNYKEINKYIAANPYKSITGDIWQFDEDQKVPVSSVPNLHMQIQNGRMTTIYTTGGKPYLDYKFQVPRWIKK
jgi:branched-chain amino acid transport system substrate-binding protein